MSETTGMKEVKSDSIPSSQHDAVGDFIKRQKERDNTPKGMSRRDFLKLAGKGVLALAGGTAAVKFISSMSDVGTGEGRIPVPPKEIPSNFDPISPDQWAGANNQIQMTLEESEKVTVPIWQKENETMTFILPIKSGDGRILTLHLKKMKDLSFHETPANNLIQIDAGLKEGDIIFSPYDGLLTVPKNTYQTALTTFYLTPGASTPSQAIETHTNMHFNTTALKHLVDLDEAVEDDWGFLNITVKKNQPIAEILTSYNGKSFNPNVQITGLASMSQKDVNLATSEGKVITIK